MSAKALTWKNMSRSSSKKAEFMRIYERYCRTGIRFKKAYMLAEYEWKRKYGTRRYCSLESFKSSRSQMHRKKVNKG